MKIRYRQQLLALESHDIVRDRFRKIHGRELNSRRAKEITAAAKQAQEFLRNAESADMSVRPLLTFYGVAGLARSLTLLLKPGSGEESLTASHGLEVVDWNSEFASEDLSQSLTKIGNLRIRTRNGLFTDFVRATENHLPIHVRSSAVDWGVTYDLPSTGREMTVMDIFLRLPDLDSELKTIGATPLYSAVQEASYSTENGFTASIRKHTFNFRQSYVDIGYEEIEKTDTILLSCDSILLNQHPPQFIHVFIDKFAGEIPRLFIAKPFSSDSRFSQLSILYMLSYILGMLTRYYPTHWATISNREKGDRLWPSLNKSQNIVEEVFPELVAEFIEDVLARKSQNSSQGR